MESHHYSAFASNWAKLTVVIVATALHATSCLPRIGGDHSFDDCVGFRSVASCSCDIHPTTSIYKILEYCIDQLQWTVFLHMIIYVLLCFLHPNHHTFSPISIRVCIFQRHSMNH